MSAVSDAAANLARCASLHADAQAALATAQSRLQDAITTEKTCSDAVAKYAADLRSAMQAAYPGLAAP